MKFSADVFVGIQPEKLDNVKRINLKSDCGISFDIIALDETIEIIPSKEFVVVQKRNRVYIQKDE